MPSREVPYTTAEYNAAGLDCLTLALENARLFEEVQRLQRDLRIACHVIGCLTIQLRQEEMSSCDELPS